MRRDFHHDGENEETAQKFSEMVAGLQYLSDAMEVFEVLEKLINVFIEHITQTKEGGYIHLCKSILPNPNAKFISHFNFFFVGSREISEGASIAQLDFIRKRLIWNVPSKGKSEVREAEKETISKIFRSCGFKIIDQSGE